MKWRRVFEASADDPTGRAYPAAVGMTCQAGEEWHCTRPPRHDGPHVAHGFYDQAIAIEDGPSELELIAIRNAAEERLNELCILLRMQFQIASLAGMERAEAPLGDQVRRVCLLARALETWPAGRL